MANQLHMIVETGEEKIVNVWDIIDAYAFNHKLMIYSYEDEPDRIYASIINEKENEVSYDPITDPNEQEYAKAEIRRVANERNNTL